jgi:hypothetical protein
MITDERAAEIAERFCDEVEQSGMNFTEFISMQMSIMRDFVCATFPSKHEQIKAWKYVQDVSKLVLNDIKQNKFIDNEQRRNGAVKP